MDVDKLIVQSSLSNHQAYVFSDSVLCVGKMGDDPNANWKSKIKWYSENNHFKDMNRIDSMPTEFEWKTFPGITTLGLLKKIQSLVRDLQCEPVTSMSSSRRFPRGHWSFLGPGSEKKWYGTYTDKPDGSWDQTAEHMMANFSESGHPICRTSSAFERRITKQSRGQEVTTLQL